jgi:hypothetical protein
LPTIGKERNTRGRCNKCHALTEEKRDVTNFTDNDFHNIGIIRHNVFALARQAQAWRRAFSNVISAYMESRPKRMDLESAKEDLKRRTLEGLGYDFARLVYISSLRDFSTGEYYHHGLAHSFSEAAASWALTACHQDLFYSLALSPLESFIVQIDRFIRSTPRDYEIVLSAWENLKAYNVTVPSVCDQIAAELFRSNIKIAMTLLKSSRPVQGEKPQSALPRPLLGQ